MKNSKEFFSAIDKYINKLETYDISLHGFVLIFLSISFFRNFLEGAMEITRTIGTSASQDTTILQMGVLFNLEWITLFFALALIINMFSKTNLISLLKLMLFFFALIIVVPFIDLSIYYPAGCTIDYLYTFREYINALLFFFIPSVDVHVCAGIRIEVFAAFIFCWSFVFIKTKNVFKSSGAAVFLYFLAVSSMAYPVFILLPAMPFNENFNAFVNNFFFGPSYGGEFLRRNSIMIFILLVPVLFLLYRAYFGQLKFIKFIRKFFNPASLILPASFACGFLSAPQRAGLPLFSNSFDIFLLISGCLICLILGAYISYDGKDVESENLNPIYITLLFISSMAVSFNFLLFIALMTVISVFYSNVPFKLGSFSFFNHIKTALYSALLFFAGFSVIAGNGFFPHINFFLPVLMFSSLTMVSTSSAHPKNSFYLLCLFTFCVFFGPALSSLPLFLGSIFCAIASFCVVRFSGTVEKRYNRLYLIFSMFFVITGLFVK